MSDDIVKDVMHEALLAVLLGSTSVPFVTAQPDGTTFHGTATVESAFVSRIQQMAYKGELDPIIQQALDLVDPAGVAKEFEAMFAKQIIAGLERNPGYGQTPGWMQQQAKGIAVEACKLALADDADLWDRLRTMIGAEVERNHVGITVSLSTPE